MRFEKRVTFFCVVLLSFGISAQERVPLLDPQSAAYRAERQKASDLFEQGKRLEALPLLEQLVGSNPKDDQMLVALAACLVDHAATLSDPPAAAKERFRARDLLDQAWKLGNTSPLAENLAHLLKELPENGVIKFSDNPEVDQIMQAGEAAFARRDYDEALVQYDKALQLEPTNYSAVLFIANTYDKKADFDDAAKWYERAMTVDPNIETAYRYYADMLAKHGDMRTSRTMLIRAAVAEPYNRMVWRELHAWATINKTEIKEVYIGQPAPQAKQPTGVESASKPAIEISPGWRAYRSVRAQWQEGEAFKRHYPNEATYRHSLGEELEALTAAAVIEEKSREAAKPGSPEDHSLDMLLKLHRAGLIEAYVLFSLGDDGIARDYAAYRTSNRGKLEDYMDKFVVPSL